IVRVRGKHHIEENKGRTSIVFTEIPFQVRKEAIFEKLKEVINEERITGIHDLQDYSDRDGIRLSIDLKKGEDPQVILNQLFQYTPLQSTQSIINLVIDRGQPRTLPLRGLLDAYIAHRKEVIRRRTLFLLGKAEERKHIVEGLRIAVDNIDEVIRIIRAAADTPEADAALRARFGLSAEQSEAILNMRLAKLTGLEIEKLEAELAEVRATIADLTDILGNRPRRMGILVDEVKEVAEQHGDERRTEIVADEGDFAIEDLIADEPMVITISHDKYLKRLPVNTYRKQKRGGRGMTGMQTKDNDWVEHLFIATTHEYLLFFTDQGHLYWLKVHEVPQSGRATKGKPVAQCINMKPDERIAAVLSMKEFPENRYLMFATRQGTVKKTALSEYGNVRANGLRAINIDDGDVLMDVQICDANNDIVLATRDGMSIRFHESDVRPMGRATSGVKGIELEAGDEVIGMVVVRRPCTLLVVSERGFGKRSELEDYRVQKRGGKGLITLKKTDKTGGIVSLLEMQPKEELMMITRQGIVIRQSVEELRVIGRNTQGVRVMNLALDDLVVSVARVAPEDVPGVEAADAAAGEGQLEFGEAADEGDDA
ncbi:MAG: DNA gyrase C-terminal beta-propeller domain-containing protein, partial [Gemmatimonadales bacterium]|nr:DNA gyrase C-terminal beta-propeller domain-containing protein [Gemmatimonadales bacterium]